MLNSHRFTAQSKVSELIHEDATLLSAISRFGIPLGFGHKTVQEVCQANNIHTPTFLAVIHFLWEGNLEVGETYRDLSIETMIHYLRNAHQFFLNYKLPSLREKLIAALNGSAENDPYQQVLLRFFDEYVDEVQKHMEYEDKVVFPYVIALIQGQRNHQYGISIFEEQHSDVDSKLSELKNILLMYSPAQGVNYALNDVLFELFSCENDLASHNQVEDFFFVPVIEAIEKNQLT